MFVGDFANAAVIVEYEHEFVIGAADDLCAIVGCVKDDLLGDARSGHDAHSQSPLGIDRETIGFLSVEQVVGDEYTGRCRGYADLDKDTCVHFTMIDSE